LLQKEEVVVAVVEDGRSEYRSGRRMKRSQSEETVNIVVCVCV
jgi:hypothetical protein